MMQHDFYTFVLVERDCFIARDLTEGLLEACPAARTQRVECLHDVIAVEGELADPTKRVVIITKAPLAEIRATGLDLLARQYCWTLVLRRDLDPVHEIEDEGFLCLASPFCREDLARMLDTLMARHAPQARYARKLVTPDQAAF